MRNLFTAFGALGVVLWLAGATGIGHFRLYYGPEPIECQRAAQKEN
ncbi:hypothetical protein [Imbroritus primus]